MSLAFACSGYLVVRRPAMIHGVVGKVSTAYKQARAKIFDDDSDGDNTRPNFTNAPEADFERSSSSEIVSLERARRHTFNPHNRHADP